MKKDKEFLYVGHYIDTDSNYILKIGTTKNLERRQKEHTRNYKKAGAHQMQADGKFEYDWTLPLSPLNTLRYERLNIERMKRISLGQYVRNDRFQMKEKPSKVTIQIRKEYEIEL
jgi:hypothetical protein